MHADTNRRLPESDRSSRFNGPPGLSGNLWPVHPHRIGDELLSSWIVRTAHANRIKLQTFTTLGFGRAAALWNRDIDRSASDDLLQALSEQTGSSIDELRDGMLSSYEGRLFERHNAVGNTDWILPLGIYHRTRKRYGVQFCSQCLFFDPVPYFRRQWRLAFSTICDVHGTMLHDRCPSCGAPVIFFRNDLGRRRNYRIGDMVSCWLCNFDYRHASAYGPVGPDGKTIAELRSLTTFYQMGWWSLGGVGIPYGHLFFDVLHHLVMLLSNRRGVALIDALAAEVGWRPTVEREHCAGPFELLPVLARHQFLVTALWLLDEWPLRFVRIARRAGLTQSRILLGETLPYWFESEIKMCLGAGYGSPTVEEARHAAAYLAKRGNSVSGAAVGRLIGSRDALAVKEFVKRKPCQATDAEFQCMITRLGDQIDSLPLNSRRRLLLQRDRTIFMLIRTTGWSVKRVLTLTVSDVEGINEMQQGNCVRLSEVGALLSDYLQSTRIYLAENSRSDKLFIKWRDGGIGEKAWGLRVSKAFVAGLNNDPSKAKSC